nr:MAG TPA: MerR HTH family regulatory protein [Caudoviricetes sp.]
MKLTNKAKEKLNDLEMMCLLCKKVGRSIDTLRKWKNEPNTRFYRSSEAVRDKFLEVMEMTEEEAFEEDDIITDN